MVPGVPPPERLGRIGSCGEIAMLQ